ncbi:hypothetical protein [Corynebacterium aquilae]|uniref:Uncharacterized protein n=1 Tax=Corynebacterium aquilae DSM 44791 TaxID=1431546 RepID=A0A1L7CFS9_9CORY|nr:hypothetical protein [Corynebacterium aquilae]APT84633.1 hypothetical protein CAQU_05635 [Corynebacterium aquilae DSM 44791]
MRFLWATRGLNWGFKFLSDGGFADPLIEYERVFNQFSTAQDFLSGKDFVAVRFDDPLGRCDSAGRIIPHECVIYGKQALEFSSATQAIDALWPKIADSYAELWDK